MNFLEYIDNIYKKEKNKFHDKKIISKEFCCFIPIKPLEYTSNNKFLIKKQKHSKLFIIIGKQRVYLSDIDIIKTILLLSEDDIRWFIDQFCKLYTYDNNACMFKIKGEEFRGSRIEYIYNETKNILLYTDSEISINDFIFVINFVLSKDSLWGKVNGLDNFRKITICKYISLLKYYAFKSKEAELFLKKIKYPIKNEKPKDTKEISRIFNDDSIKEFDISLFM